MKYFQRKIYDDANQVDEKKNNRIKNYNLICIWNNDCYKRRTDQYQELSVCRKATIKCFPESNF